GAGLALGDPNLIILPPVPLTRQSSLFRSVSGISTLSDAEHRVTLWSPDAVAITLDDSPLTDVTAVLSAGDHVIEADGPFQGIAYGLSAYEAYTYSLGYDCTGCLPLLSEAPTCP
ncbi:MAG: hypothetical protein ACI8S6_003868, partial [Myxococcota bacterium]